MPTAESMDDVILELQTKLQEHARAGITATLECVPSVVIGRETVSVRARFFGSAKELATLAPVLHCEEVVDFDGRHLKAGRREGEYMLTLPPGSVDSNTTYHLTLHPLPDAGAAAGCTLHTFSARVVATAQRRIREVLGAQRTGGAAPSPRPRRASRRRRT